jgi:ribonuclease P protein component
MLTSPLRYTFRKPEKICNQKQIDYLFKEGKSMRSGLFQLIYRITGTNSKWPVQLLIAVPKKHLHHAVERNRMKRLIREAYRISKHKVVDSITMAGKHCDIALVYTGQQCISQTETHAAINELLDRLIRANEKDPQ